MGEGITEGKGCLRRAEVPGSLPMKEVSMGDTGSREDFEWVYTDQPHTDRRKEILGECQLGFSHPSLSRGEKGVDREGRGNGPGQEGWGELN